MKNKLIVINLFGAPSAGKSVAMLGLTYNMKIGRYSVENTPEFAKELAIEKRFSMFGRQLYILGEQSKRLDVLTGQYDFAVTDCPLQLISFYTPKDYIKSFSPMVDELFDTYENVNYFIHRNHSYEDEGRVHDEEQSNLVAKELHDFLIKKNIYFKELDTSQDIVGIIMSDLKNTYGEYIGNNISKKSREVPNE